MIILQNSIRCLSCKEKLISKHTQDFRKCGCGKVGVDGGKEYLRRIGERENFEECSVFQVESYSPSSWSEGFLIWSPQGKTNPQTIFMSRKEAEETADRMRKEYGGDWYLAGPLIPAP